MTPLSRKGSPDVWCTKEKHFITKITDFLQIIKYFILFSQKGCVTPVETQHSNLHLQVKVVSSF